MTALLSLQDLKKKISEICQACHRKSEDVRILAVSKLQPLEKIQQLKNSGQVDFGENYVQELLRKHNEFPDSEIKWHLIGHLQRNKVKNIIGVCDLIHSVDSLALAQEISRRAENSEEKQKILLQVNTSGEASKEGFNKDSLLQSFSQILQLPGIHVKGLMTMPPFVENPEDNRVYFRSLRLLLSELQTEFPQAVEFTDLSMGTSQDYEVAIAEGATWIRLGTTLFGERQ